MKTRYDYDTLIMKSIILAFKLDDMMDISVKPRKYGMQLAGMLIDISHACDFKLQQKILCECREVEIEINSLFKNITTPRQSDFWYEVLTDWFSPLNPKESFVLKCYAKKIPIKKIYQLMQVKFGEVPSRKSLYNWKKNALDKIKCHLWKKEIRAKHFL